VVNIALGNRIFAIGDGLDFESEVGAPGNGNMNKYVTGGGCACGLASESALLYVHLA
jgi:hypothetical protein